MQHAGLTIGMVAIGLGLASIGFNLNGNQASATTAAPVAFNAGPDEPTIVWYDSHPSGNNSSAFSITLLRGWSDGTIEARHRWWDWDRDNGDCDGQGAGLRNSTNLPCDGFSGWFVISSPNEGLNAAADINHDEIVNAADIGLLVAAWGDAPRNPMPPSDCPLGLIP